MKKIAVVVPAINEEKVIQSTLKPIIALIGKVNVFVVDDGSKDNTSQIAGKLTRNVLTLNKNGGKANALNSAIRHFKLTKRYKYIMPVDADTVISPDFFKFALPVFDRDKKIVCVVGKVVGRNRNWVTNYRLWEYEINQAINKQAQDYIGGITVCPGPSTIYRSVIFNRIKYSDHTQTEDMDLTFTIHRRKLGRIVFEPKATVTTQDPGSIRVYVKQIKRWYTGFWQCLTKHNVPWGGKSLDFEAALLATDGLLNVFLAIFFLALIPTSLFWNPVYIAIPLLIDLVFFMLPAVVYVSFKRKTAKIILYLPHFYLMRFVGSLIFFYSFLNVSLGLDMKLKKAWHTQRYKVRKEEIWVN